MIGTLVTLGGLMAGTIAFAGLIEAGYPRLICAVVAGLAFAVGTLIHDLEDLAAFRDERDESEKLDVLDEVLLCVQGGGHERLDLSYMGAA